MSIKKLLIFGFSIAIVLSLLTGLIGFNSAVNTTEQLDVLVHKDMGLRELALEMQVSLLMHRRYEKDIFLNIGNVQKQQKYLQKLDGATASMRDAIAKIQALTKKIPEIPSQDRNAVNTFNLSYDKYINGFKQLAQRAMTENITPGEANKLMKPFKEHLYTMSDTLDRLGKISHEILIDASNKTLAQVYDAEKYIIIACLFSLISGILTAFFIFRSINTPVTTLIDLANQVASGNLNASTDKKLTGEMAELYGALSKMVQELKSKLGFAEGVLNAIPTPCGIVAPDFTMSWVNQELCDLLEKEGTPDSYKGVRSGELYWDDKDKETLSDKAIKQQKRLHTTCERPLNSGRTLFVDVTTTPVYDLNGGIIGSVSFWYDLTSLNDQKKFIEEQNCRISNAAQEASRIADQVAIESGQLETQINQTSQGAMIQSERMGETATAVEQMNATTLEVASNAAQAAQDADTAQQIAADGAKIVSNVVQTTEEVQKYAHDMRETIMELGTQAQAIGGIINVINDIADQTNLLALNAAIEAARAGEAGRGFAVVADEVRKLAEKTMQATNEVETVVRGIQNSSDSTLDQMEKVASHIGRNTELTMNAGTALEQIVEAGTQTADRVRSIATASEEQSAASEQIARASDEVNSLTQEAAQGMTEAAQAVAALAALSQKLEEVMRDIQQ